MTHPAVADAATIYRLADEPRHHARERPDHPAVTDDRRSLTFADLDERTSRLAAGLVGLGVTPGCRVLVLDRSSVELIEVVLGAAKAGAVTVSANWRLAADDLAPVLADASPSVVIAGAEFVDVLPVEIGSAGGPRLLVIDGNTATRGLDYEDWLATQPARDPGFRGGPDDVVLQLYTSGTTGASKGVMITNANLGACSRSGARWGLDKSAVSLCAMPMFHIGGLGWALVGMALGAHNVILRDVVPETVLDVLEQRRITNVFLVPAVIGMLCDLPDAGDRDWSALRSVAYGSSPITPALLRRALSTFSRPFYQVYGLTETTGAITQLDAEDHDPGGPREPLLRTAGRPYPWVELEIRSLDGSGVAAPGVPGEVCVRSAQVCPGYYGRPDDTAAAIDGDGWFHTGDVGFLDADGYLTISDRIKELVITGGENVSAVEVEAVLAEHPSVAEVAVVGRPDARWGESVTAVVVPRSGASLELAEVRAFCKDRLAGFKCPTSLVIVDEMPRGATGKILKRVLKDQVAG